MSTLHRFLLVMMVGVFVGITGPAVAERPVSDDMQPVLDRLILHHQAWGELGIDTCAHARNAEPLPLRIGTTDYASGFGSHAPGELVFMLDGECKSFSADLGVQPQSQGVGSVVFTIYVDGEMRFTSDVLRENDPPVPVTVDVTGADELRVVIADAGDGITCDVANIGDPQLIPNPDAGAIDVRRLEIGSFGTVKSWPPSRTDGTAGKRTEPFPPGDVYLGTPIRYESGLMLPVPVDDHGVGCIGIEWAARRLLREASLRFASTNDVPPLDHVTLQVWDGESPWQGHWVDVPAQPDLIGDYQPARPRLAIQLPFPKDGARRGTEKIRWLIRECPSGLQVADVEATSFTRMRKEPVTLRMALEHYDWPDGEGPLSANFPFAGAPVFTAEEPPSGHRDSYIIDIHNGFRVNTSGDLGVPAIKPGGWQEFQLLCAESRLWKADRTVVQFRFPEHPVAIAIDDVLEQGSVYIPSVGLLVTRDDVETSFEMEREQIKALPSLLNKVRAMPDQTLEQAMEHVHNPIQDLGPMMLSLACDNRKFVAFRNGSVTFEPYSAPDDEIPLPQKYRYRLDVLHQGEIGEPETRTLRGDWLPAPTSTWRDGNVVYTQCVYVTPLDETPVDPEGWLFTRAACIVELEARVEGSEPAPISTEVRFVADATAGTLTAFDPSASGFCATLDGMVRAIVIPHGASALEPTIQDGKVVLAGELKLGETASLRVLLPAWELGQDAVNAMPVADDFDAFARYWGAVMAPATQVSLPDPFLTDLIRASQVHCLLAARNEAMGERVAAWISSDRYGPLESEAHSVIRGMDLFGNADYARRSLDFFIHRYAPEGYLTTGYTIVGTGWHLWTLAEHVARTGDTEWLERVAPDVARACQWIVDERKKTMDHGEFSMPAEHPSAACPPECGLVTPGVAADWNRYAYRFFQEGHYYAGLKHAAQALEGIGYKGATSLEAQADALRESTLRAYRYTQGRAPAQALDTGAWIPAYPGMLYCFGRIEDIIAGEDANRSWCYDVELGAHHLAVLGVLEPKSDEVGDMLEHMEEYWFLHQGMNDYPEDKNHEDWYNLGGFAKVQPYYARNAELYAMRDDVKPFIRSYFNTIPTLVSRENLSFWEHYHNTGGWNKTHETGYFLAQTREMLIQERGNELWIAPFIPEQWLRDGNSIVVENAPTTFGPVSYSIEYQNNAGSFSITLDADFRIDPKKIVIRLRHPDKKGFEKVTGKVFFKDIQTHGNMIEITPPLTEPVKIHVVF